MKRCPSCQGTYMDDAPDFCPNDGMRLIGQESVAASFDPEETMFSADARSANSAQVESPQAQAPAQTSLRQEAAAPPPPSHLQQDVARQAWQPTAPQQTSPAQPQPVQPAPATPWGGAQQQEQRGNAVWVPVSPAPFGKRRSLAIASLVFGSSVATVVAMVAVRSRDFTRTLMLLFSILGITLGAAALYQALRNPNRFGGVELAIAGLALGATGLVYTLLNW